MFSLIKINKNINIMNVFINSHTISKFIQRNKGYKKINIPKQTTLALVIQRNKGDIKIKELKGVITLEDGLYAIVNIYQNKITSELNLKVLTVLTSLQLASSYNLGFANHLEYGITLSIQNVKKEEMFFDYNENSDYIRGIKWLEQDVVEPYKLIDKLDVDNKLIKVPKLDGIIRHNELYNGKKINIIQK